MKGLYVTLKGNHSYKPKYKDLVDLDYFISLIPQPEGSSFLKLEAGGVVAHSFPVLAYRWKCLWESLPKRDC